MKIKLKKSIPLSVGMIVKNEGANLDRCLTALQPLLKAVNGELVIVDTGSTDDSVAVAEKYTDKVFHFEWCDDFAAARNFGLEKCSGEWYMFIDADEFLDTDISGMTEFFTTPLSKKYNAASYIQRNYDIAGSTAQYNDYWAVRVARRAADLRFTGAVHEYLNIYEPIYNLRTFVNHWGYAYETPEAATAKKLKYYKILKKEHEREPQNIKVMVHMLDCDFKNKDETMIKMREQVRSVHQNDEEFIAKRVLLKKIAASFMDKQPEESLAAVYDYFEENNDLSLISLEMYGIKGNALSKQQRYKEALIAYAHFLQLHKAYLQKKIPEDDKMRSDFLFAYPRYVRMIRESYFKLRDTQGEIDDRYKEELQLFICELAMSEKDFEKYPEMIFQGLKHNLDLSPLWARTNYENIRGVIAHAAQLHPFEFADVVTDIKADGMPLWLITALESAVLATRSAEKYDMTRLYKRFAHETAAYVRSIYNPDILNADDANVLPPLHLFGYYAGADSENYSGEYSFVFEKINNAEAGT